MMLTSKCLANCTATARLEVFSKSFIVSCTTLKRMLYHQPLTVTVGRCQESLWGVHPCENRLFCGSMPSIVVGCAYLLLALVLISVLCSLRHTKLKEELWSDGITLKVIGCMIHSYKDSQLVSKYNVVKYLLFLVTGAPVVLSCARLVPGGVIVVPGSTICTTLGNFTVTDLSFDVELNFEFDTYDYQFGLTSDWGCAGGSCPSIEDCEKMDEEGPRFTGKRFTKSFCNMFPNACTFGRGCKFGVKELKLSSPMEVYSVSAFRLPIGRVEYLKGDCQMREDKVTSIPEGTLTIVASRDATYLCPFYHNKGYAHAGMLGDVQVLKDSSAVDWMSFSCSTGWYNNRFCLTPASFVSNLEAYCCKFPCPYGSGVFAKRNGRVVFEPSDPQIVSLTCNRTSIIQENATCDEPRIEIWGTRESGLGIYLSMQAFSANPNQDLSYSNPCLDEELVIPCDGKIRFYPLSEDARCNFTDKTMWAAEASFMGAHFRSDFNPISHIFRESTPWWLHMVGSGWCIIVAILILILMVRK